MIRRTPPLFKPDLRESMSDATATVQAASLAQRPKRADARRNFDKLLAAAAAAFAQDGADASLEDIARRAGVGIGTLYRNFPTREALLEAVYVDEVQEMSRSAAAAASSLSKLRRASARLGRCARLAAWTVAVASLMDSRRSGLKSGGTLRYSVRQNRRKPPDDSEDASSLATESPPARSPPACRPCCTAGAPLRAGRFRTAPDRPR